MGALCTSFPAQPMGSIPFATTRARGHTVTQRMPPNHPQHTQMHGAPRIHSTSPCVSHHPGRPTTDMTWHPIPSPATLPLARPFLGEASRLNAIHRPLMRWIGGCDTRVGCMLRQAPEQEKVQDLTTGCARFRVTGLVVDNHPHPAHTLPGHQPRMAHAKERPQMPCPNARGEVDRPRHTPWADVVRAL